MIIISKDPRVVFQTQFIFKSLKINYFRLNVYNIVKGLLYLFFFFLLFFFTDNIVLVLFAWVIGWVT